MMRLELTEESLLKKNNWLKEAPTRECIYFLKIDSVFAGGGFYSYYIHQGNKSVKERKIVSKKKNFLDTKKIKYFF